MKVSLISLGCKVNQYESESIAKKLQDNGVEVNFGIKPADVFVLNTCAVTNEAERKSRGIIAKILKINPAAKIYVCGCSAQNNPERFAKSGNVVSIYGTGRKMDIAEFILKHNLAVARHNAISESYEDVYLPLPSHTRAYIKIQDGCNNFCSYCLIPYLRGRSRSRELSSVKAEIAMHSHSAKEVILTGINLSAYGLDLKPKLSLSNVADLFDEFPKLRFRFSSLEVNIITKEFLLNLAKKPNFCPHFHLSLQSGSDKVLLDMNRHYDSKQFLSKVCLIREIFPDAAITTDVIVGFPTEGEEEFEQTYLTCKTANFAFIHIFPYSTRQGTNALKFKNIALNVNDRIARLTKLRDEMAINFVKLNSGKVLNCLIESKRIDGFYTGHTENFIKCYISGQAKLNANEIYKVIIGEPFKDGAKVELIK